MCDVFELVGYSIAYAKKFWRRAWRTAFQERRLRLILVSVQRPRWLTEDAPIRAHCVSPGVYDLPLLNDTARLIVPREAELIPRNALWHLFSGDLEQVRYGLRNFRVRDATLYNVRRRLSRIYGLEDLEMPYTKDDFIRETLEEFTPQQRMAGLSKEDRLAGLSTADRLDGLSPDEVERYLREIRQRQQAKPSRKRGNKR